MRGKIVKLKNLCNISKLSYNNLFNHGLNSPSRGCTLVQVSNPVSKCFEHGRSWYILAQS